MFAINYNFSTNTIDTDKFPGQLLLPPLYVFHDFYYRHHRRHSDSVIEWENWKTTSQRYRLESICHRVPYNSYKWSGPFFSTKIQSQSFCCYTKYKKFNNSQYNSFFFQFIAHIYIEHFFLKKKNPNRFDRTPAIGQNQISLLVLII